MTTLPPADDDALDAPVRRDLEDLARVTRVVAYAGEAHERYPWPEDDPADRPLAVIDDADLVRDVVDALRTATLAERTVVPALPGIRLELLGEAGPDDEPDDPADEPDEHAHLRTVHLLSSRRVRGWWPYDATLARPLPRGLTDRLRDHLDPTGATLPAPVGSPPDAADAAEMRRLTAAWERERPGEPPVAWWLRSAETWVRFHSLPGSKRYADTEEEYAEILHRHRTVLGELADALDEPHPDVVVVTLSVSAGPLPVPRSAPVVSLSPAAQHWCSVPDPGGDDDPSWFHLFADRVSLDDPRLRQLLLLAADDVTFGVLLLDLDVRWVYHPYDGGADVYPATVAQRDDLRRRHKDWLSRHPRGL